jgi:hypothetical protein
MSWRGCRFQGGLDIWQVCCRAAAVCSTHNSLLPVTACTLCSHLNSPASASAAAAAGAPSPHKPSHTHRDSLLAPSKSRAGVGAKSCPLAAPLPPAATGAP